MNKKTLHNFVELIPELIDNSLWVHQYMQTNKLLSKDLNLNIGILEPVLKPVKQNLEAG